MQSFEYTVTDPIGIHARPAGVLVKEIRKYPGVTVTVTRGEDTVNALRLMALMGMAIKQGETVTVRVEGAILAGCGTGNPRTEERFQDETHPLFEGRMLAVVKAGAERGTATVRVCGESLPETAVTIEIL